MSKTERESERSEQHLKKGSEQKTFTQSDIDTRGVTPELLFGALSGKTASRNADAVNKLGMPNFGDATTKFFDETKLNDKQKNFVDQTMENVDKWHSAEMVIRSINQHLQYLSPSERDDALRALADRMAKDPNCKYNLLENKDKQGRVTWQIANKDSKWAERDNAYL